jgi:hypothetical protein
MQMRSLELRQKLRPKLPRPDNGSSSAIQA